MLDVSSLYCEDPQDGDPLRYGRGGDQKTFDVPRSASRRKPVVVLNLTRSCNLTCEHCYAGSGPESFPGELSTTEWKYVLDDLAAFGVPAVLLSGGEPLVHPDFFELLEHADYLGLRTALSTNGTLITPTTARRLRDSGVTYVGISFDGIGGLHDDFRGADGAFERALRGLRYCRDAGQKVGVRTTLTPPVVSQLDVIFVFLLEEGVHRVCFYHLAYGGRGVDLRGQDLSDDQRRWAMKVIFERTRELHRAGIDMEVLTVANPADNAFLYLQLLEEDPDRAGRVLERLRWNGGALNGSGVGLACIDFYGRVHPNQFWTDRVLGNVRERPFSRIWADDSNGLLQKLRQRRLYLEDPCASCRFLEVCGGGLRVRADAIGDLWGSDPSCYLSRDEKKVISTRCISPPEEARR